MNLLLALVTLFLFLFVLVFTLVGYTSILDNLPMYKSRALAQRELVVESIMRIDSMERVIAEMMLYTDNVASIMSNRTPISKENPLPEHLSLSKSILQPNRVDSILRAEMEGETKYNITLSAFRTDKYMTAPTDGEIISEFNLAEGSYGVELSSISKHIMASQRGVVTLAEWTPSSGYVVVVAHPNGVVSIYRRLNTILVECGASVKEGEVIGERGEESRTIGFEIWREGRAVDPQSYVTF